ncbi:hypothetical protein F350042L8_06660 [Fusobacterium ulcerans]|uniref:phage tail-collar fiber domain-containing protein n=1 Tax=Fusobacterium ulcerans TaxID=861 RepID=UPI0034B2C6B0
MGYNGLTNFGIEYQARMTAENKPVTLTKVRVGNGSIPASQTGATTTNLYSYKKEVEILAKEQVENAVKLQILLNNLDQEIGFYVKELGVYVQDGAEEKLYWYINKDNPSYLDNKNVPSKHRYNLFLEVTNVETIIINFTGQGLLADKKYVDDSIADFETGYNITLNDIRNKINSKMVAGTLINSMNTGENIVKALQGNAGLNFDPNLLYLDNIGTKTKGYVYLDSRVKGVFECLNTTSSTANETVNFLNISNKSNSDKLENLSKTKLIFNNKQTTETGIFTLDDSIEKYKFINIVYAFGGDPTKLISVGSAVFNTDFLKSHYNSGLAFANTAIAENGVNVTFEHLYVKFINGTQINIEENRSTNNAVLNNNKIHQIYAWN